MSNLLPIRLTNYRTGHQWRICSIMILTGLLNWVTCSAQLSKNYSADHSVKAPWRYAYLPDARYALHARALQHQVKGLLKPLIQLSVDNPPAYSTFQVDLHTYLDNLDKAHTDYSNLVLYQTIQLQLVLFENRIKAALVECRRTAYEQSQTNDPARPLAEGHRVVVRPYALLFRKPNHRSSLLHVILPKETVTVLEDGPRYCVVQCSFYKGYMSKAMIVDYP